MRVRLLAKAQAELGAALEHIAADNPLAAIQIEHELMAVLVRLAERAFEGPEVMLRTGQRVRTWPVPPFRIFYRRTGDELRVLRIRHYARRPLTP